MWNVWIDDGLGMTKAAIIAAGGVKVRKGVFRLPSGAEIVPDDEGMPVGGGGGGGGSTGGGSGSGSTGGSSGGGGGDGVHAPGETWCLDPCTSERYEANEFDWSKGTGGGVCPRRVPAGGCPPGATGGGGGGTAGGGSGGSGGIPYGDDTMVTSTEPSGDVAGGGLSFLTQSIGGIPIWAIGVGVFLLLPMLRGGRR